METNNSTESIPVQEQIRCMFSDQMGFSLDVVEL
jgi:hypothetical protein